MSEKKEVFGRFLIGSDKGKTNSIPQSGPEMRGGWISVHPSMSDHGQPGRDTGSPVSDEIRMDMRWLYASNDEKYHEGKICLSRDEAIELASELLDSVLQLKELRQALNQEKRNK